MILGRLPAMASMTSTPNARRWGEVALAFSACLAVCAATAACGTSVLAPDAAVLDEDAASTPVAAADAAALAADAAVVDAFAPDALATDAMMAPAPDPVGWRNVPPMSARRMNHTATLLPDGRVLVIGGEDFQGRMHATIEAFDPATERWQTMTPLPTGLANHSATLLPSGQVLVAGGGLSNTKNYPGDDARMTSYSYDPIADTISETGALNHARSHHRAVWLPSGKVLAVGGGSGSYATNPNFADILTSAELYDPSTGSWMETAPTARARAFHTLSALPDGRAIVVAGVNEMETSFADAEIFDPAAGLWSTVPSMPSQDRFRHATCVLADGRVLVAAGKKANTGFLSSALTYEPLSGSWSIVGAVTRGGNSATLTPLSSGNAIFVGGYGAFGGGEYEFSARTQLFDASTGQWTQLAPLAQRRTGHTTTRLTDGRVLVLGGLGEDLVGNAVALGSAEISVLP
mgnify:CR=1 FL=1